MKQQHTLALSISQDIIYYNTYTLVTQELWQRKQTCPSGFVLEIGLFTAIIPWHPVDNYYLYMEFPGYPYL